MIPYGKQDISKEDIDTVLAVLKSDFLTQGPMVPKFEKALSISVGAEYVTAVNSATSALHLACIALGVGVGVIGISSANPKVFNQVLRYYPWLVAIVGLVSFSDIVTEFISGDYDFALYDDAQNAYHLFIIGSVIAGIGNLLNMR